MSDELPPGFEFNEQLRLLSLHGMYIDGVAGIDDTSFETRDEAVAEAWRIYRAVELDVLRDLEREFSSTHEDMADIVYTRKRRIAELEGGER